MKLETSALDGVAFGELYGKLLERVADLEAEGPRGEMGRGVGLPSTTKSSRKSVSDSKVVLNLAELTDEKNKFRQWDTKFANALAHVEKSYGWALERIKECVDEGGEEEPLVEEQVEGVHRCRDGEVDTNGDDAFLRGAPAGWGI